MEVVEEGGHWLYVVAGYSRLPGARRERGGSLQLVMGSGRGQRIVTSSWLLDGLALLYVFAGAGKYQAGPSRNICR